MSGGDAHDTDFDLLWQFLHRNLVTEEIPFPPGIIPLKRLLASKALLERSKTKDSSDLAVQLSELREKFFDYAVQNDVDPMKPGWELDVVALAFREHPLLGSRRSPGRPKISPNDRYSRLIAFVTPASRLRAIMQLNRGGPPVSDRDLARQIVQRESEPGHLADKNWAWPGDRQFEDRVYNMERYLPRYRDQLRALRKQGIRTQKTARILSGRQKDHQERSWEPSETELERYPEWKMEQRKIWAEWFPPER